MSNNIQVGPKLGVNIDHVATLRQARRIDYPDPTEIALLAEEAGADYITLHLREDRRHIQDSDLQKMRDCLKTHINLEMAATSEMLTIAKQAQPKEVCLVPEKRQELTTEGGLDVITQFDNIYRVSQELLEAGIEVSLFIDTQLAQIEAATKTGAQTIEIHTGHYANTLENEMDVELDNILKAAQQATDLRLEVNAGHGLNYDNVQPVAACPHIRDLNIGHSIISRSLYVGIKQAVIEMKELLAAAR